MALTVSQFYDENFYAIYRGIDDETGLDAIISIHNINLGPALGGCRILSYDSIDDHLADAKRLSRAMTYKNALAGLPLGGGKSVINIKGQEKTPELLTSFGEFLNVVNKDRKDYITAGDVGSGPRELAIIAAATEFIQGEAGTDSGVATGYGVFNAIKGAAMYDNRSLETYTVAINGLGKVGARLAGFLKDVGATLYVSDINEEYGREVAQSLGATFVHPDFIHAVSCDIYAPCAVGGAINEDTVDHLDCRFVIGGANNQLDTPEMGARLKERGIMYAPDYVSNSGGVIIIEKRGKEYIDLEYDDDKVMPKLEAIADTTLEIFRRTELEDSQPEIVADKMAEEIWKKKPHTGWPDMGDGATVG